MRKHHLLGTYNLRIVERPILFSNHLTKTVRKRPKIILSFSWTAFIIIQT